MSNLINRLQELLPEISFVAGDSFYWSPKTKLVTFISEDSETNDWALLHEAAHAQLDHQSYDSDFELLQLEVAAWDKARILGNQFDVTIDENHIQDCLDTYRDWLHQRSTCPSCSSVSFQASPREYRCHNCHTTWQVSNSRFCRPYRLRTFDKNKKSPEKTQTTFA